MKEKKEKRDAAYIKKYKHLPPPEGNIVAKYMARPEINNPFYNIGYTAGRTVGAPIIGLTNLVGEKTGVGSPFESPYTQALDEIARNRKASTVVGTGMGMAMSAFPYVGLEAGTGALISKITPNLATKAPMVYSGLTGTSAAVTYGLIVDVASGRPAEEVVENIPLNVLLGMVGGPAARGVKGAEAYQNIKVLRGLLAKELKAAAKDPEVVAAIRGAKPMATTGRSASAPAVTPKAGASAALRGAAEATPAPRPVEQLRGLEPWEMTLDEWRLVGNNGKGKAYLPNASSKTAKAVNAGVDARYKSLVEAAMGEGKAVPRFVRNQSMFTGGMPGTAGPRRPLTKTEFDARFSAGERIPDGEIISAKRTHPLTQSEYNAMIGERPAQAMPRSAKEPLPTPETARGKIVEGQSIEGNPTGKVREPAIAGAGKTGDEALAGKGIEARDDGFREGLIGKEGKRAESASDGFTEGLLGKEGKAGGSIEYTLESTGNTYIKNKKPVEVKQFTKELLMNKPKHSPTPEYWYENGGKIFIDEDGVWTYLDWENHSVSYPNGYPDFKSAGLVLQEVKVPKIKTRASDFVKADILAPNGPKSPGNTWHHHQDMKTLQEIDSELHRRFTHKGGIAGLRK